MSLSWLVGRCRDLAVPLACLAEAVEELGVDAGRPADDAVRLGRSAGVHARLGRLERDHLVEVNFSPRWCGAEGPRLETGTLKVQRAVWLSGACVCARVRSPGTLG